MLEEDLPWKVSSNNYMNKYNQELKNLQMVPLEQKYLSRDKMNF